MRSQPASKWLEAGHAALQRGAWTEAKSAFRRALAAETSAEGLEGLGWSLYWLGAAEESLEEREHAYRVFLDRKQRADAARVALGLAVGSYDLRGDAVARGWLERARNLLRGVPVTIIHGWLSFYEGHLVRMSGDGAREARRLARAALRIAVRFDDPQLQLLASALEGLTLVSEGKIAEGMRRVDEATTAAMAGEMRDLDAVAQTCCILLYACERVRDYKRAAEWQQRILHFCKRCKIEPLFAVCSTQRAAMLTGCGDWSEAEAELERALERLETTRPLLVPDALVQLAELRRRQGRYDEALALARRVETRTEAMLTQAAIALDSGDPAGALDYADRVLARPLGEKWVERAVALQLVVRAALQLGDRPRAERAHEALRKIASGVDAPIIRATERLAAGDLAADAGALDEARAAYFESFERFEAVRAPFEAACARMALARTLAALGRAAAAAQEIAAAVAAFERLGAARERQKALELRQRSEAGPLTERESEVLHLIAEGLGDKQLAVRLSLSEHTVHRHVANILRKLGAGSRTAAVAQAMRSGWLSGAWWPVPAICSEWPEHAKPADRPAIHIARVAPKNERLSSLIHVAYALFLGARNRERNRNHETSSPPLRNRRSRPTAPRRQRPARSRAAARKRQALRVRRLVVRRRRDPRGRQTTDEGPREARLREDGGSVGRPLRRRLHLGGDELSRD